MKKYITPEIEALALDTVDIITNSVFEYAAEDIAAELSVNKEDVQTLTQAVKDMTSNKWSW